MITIFTVLMLIFMKTIILDGKEDGKQQTPRHGFGRLDGEDGIMTSSGVRSLQSLSHFSGLQTSILKTVTKQ